MRTEILVRVVNKGNKTCSAFRVAYKHQSELDDTLRRIFPLLLNKGILSCEYLGYDLQLNNVTLQQGKHPDFKDKNTNK